MTRRCLTRSLILASFLPSQLRDKPLYAGILAVISRTDQAETPPLLKSIYTKRMYGCQSLFRGLSRVCCSRELVYPYESLLFDTFPSLSRKQLPTSGIRASAGGGPPRALAESARGLPALKAPRELQQIRERVLFRIATKGPLVPPMRGARHLCLVDLASGRLSLDRFMSPAACSRRPRG
jgi:hypothetical protein